jgi:hypothetical protein
MNDMLAVYLIEKLGVMFDRNFDVMSDVRSNDILEVFRGYVGIFCLMMRFSFSNDFRLYIIRPKSDIFSVARLILRIRGIFIILPCITP